MTMSAPSGLRAGPGELTNEELCNFVASPLAACSTAGLDPDEWFPIAAQAARARAEASRALAVCTLCPVRAECLEMSFRQWGNAGQHGIWGGLVEADRESLRREWRNGVPVAELLSRLYRRPAIPKGGRTAPPDQDFIAGPGKGIASRVTSRWLVHYLAFTE